MRNFKVLHVLSTHSGTFLCEMLCPLSVVFQILKDQKHHDKHKKQTKEWITASNATLMNSAAVLVQLYLSTWTGLVKLFFRNPLKSDRNSACTWENPFCSNSLMNEIASVDNSSVSLACSYNRWRLIIVELAYCCVAWALDVRKTLQYSSTL